MGVPEGDKRHGGAVYRLAKNSAQIFHGALEDLDKSHDTTAVTLRARDVFILKGMGADVDDDLHCIHEFSISDSADDKISQEVRQKLESSTQTT